VQKLAARYEAEGEAGFERLVIRLRPPAIRIAVSFLKSR
jgi:hypothetical protein